MVLKFFGSIRKSSGWLCLNVAIFELYVSDAAEAGFRHILTLMLLLAFSSSVSALMSGIGGVSIRACTSALR